MKKWGKHLLMTVFLFAFLSPLAVSAKDTGGAMFAANGNNVNLYLDIEDGVAKGITSLRLQLFVEVEKGTWAMEEGSFAEIKGVETLDLTRSPFKFNGQIASEVKDVKVSRNGRAYIIDITLSGTSRIFEELVRETITGRGTASAEISESSDAAVLEYVMASAFEPFKLHLTNAAPVILESGSGANPASEEGSSQGVLLGTLTLADLPAEDYRIEIGLVPENGFEASEPETEKKPETDPSKPEESETNPPQTDPQQTEPPQTDPSQMDPQQTDSESEPQTESSEPSETDPQQTDPSNPSETDLLQTESESETTQTDPQQTESESETTQTEPSQTDPTQTDPSKPGETDPGNKPSETDPIQPDTSDSGDNTKPQETEETEPQETEIPEEPRPFAKKTDPQLKISSPLAGAAYVHFSWKEIEGADGYEIRKIKDNGKAKLIATVMAEEGTEFEKMFAYGKTLQFKIRAFQLDDEGDKVYGEYGSVVTIQTPAKTVDAPTTVKAAAASRTSKKITITWQNPANADGIRIYMRTEKTGPFETIRTIDGTAITTYTVTKKRGETYTFRIAGYKYVNGQPALFSNYSSEASVTTTPGKVSGVTLALNEKGKPKITWKKVARAEAYQVYRCETLTGTYERLTTIKKRSKVTYTDKEAESGKTYYYKVRAYITGMDGANVYGYSSNPQPITAN